MQDDPREAARKRLQAMIEAVTDEAERAELVAHLARYDRDAVALMDTHKPTRRGAAGALRASVATHSGDNRNMAAAARGSGATSQVWWAWNGNWNPASLRRQRVEGHYEPVYAGVSSLQVGRYGTQTPPDRKHIARVMPGLA